MPSNHELRRDHVIGQAVAAGKFAESRSAHWQQEYDRDPARTEQVLAALASVHPQPPYPRELFPASSSIQSAASVASVGVAMLLIRSSSQTVNGSPASSAATTASTK